MVDYRAAPEGGPNSWSAGFLPGAFQGTPVRSTGPVPSCISIRCRTWGFDRQRQQLDFADPAQSPASRSVIPGKPTCWVASIVLAAPPYRTRRRLPRPSISRVKPPPRSAGMARTIPTASLWFRDPLSTRRLIERGVRFVQVYSGGTTDSERWDAHKNLKKNHLDRAAETDVPVAGLLTDLKHAGCSIRRWSWGRRVRSTSHHAGQ